MLGFPKTKLLLTVDSRLSTLDCSSGRKYGPAVEFFGRPFDETE